MSWPPPETMKEVDAGLLGDLSPEEVLYEFEGPCIFTSRSPAGGLLLTYLSEDMEGESCLRYLVVTTSDETISAMKEGVVSVRESLLRGSMWIADLDYGLKIKHVFSVLASDLPDDAMPADGTMLWASLEPALCVRLEGTDIRPGKIPALVVAQAGTIAAKALKSVFEWAARELLPDTSGRPPEWLRALYNLPTQRLAYGSLELSFRYPDIPPAAQTALPLTGEPETPSIDDLVENGWSLLRRGLEWASEASSEEWDEEFPSDDTEERLAILEALRCLAPGSTGPVAQVIISGTKVGETGRVHRLNRTASTKIRKRLTTLKKQKKIQLKVLTGRVRDLDLDKLTFILRDVQDEPNDFDFILEDEQFLETAKDAHYQELEVTVVGRSTDAKTWTAVQLEFKREDDPEEG